LEKDSEGNTIETCDISTCTFQTRSWEAIHQIHRNLEEFTD